MEASRNEITDIVTRAIAEISGVSASRLTAETPIDQLGLDSVALSEVLIVLEDSLSRELPFEALERFEGVQNLGEVCEILSQIVGALPAVRQG